MRHDRYHAESNINILLTRNLTIDSSVRQWSHLLMIPLHSLWAKSSNSMRGQFECDVTLVLFLFWFRSFTCTVRFLSHSLLERLGIGLNLDVLGWTGGGGVLKIRQYWWASYVYRPLVDGWRLQTNATELKRTKELYVRCCDSFRYISMKQLLQLNKSE